MLFYFHISLCYIFVTLQIQEFLKFVKSIYMELPENINKIFQPRGEIRVKDLSEINVEELLMETFTTTLIKCEKKNPDGTTVSDVSVS